MNEDHPEILRLLNENQVLLKQNNELLHKIHRFYVVGLTVKLIWYAILIGLPFALYFYVLEPYFNVFGSNYEVFRQGIAEIPGLKGLEHLMPAIGE
jgi:hypothetical protein